MTRVGSSIRERPRKVTEFPPAGGQRSVLCVSLSRQIGGAERSLLTVGPLLDSIGWSVALAAPPGAVTREARSLGLRVHEVHWFDVPAISEPGGTTKRYPVRRLVRSMASSVLNVGLLALLVRRARADVVMSNSFAAHPFVVFGAKALRIPSVLYLRDIAQPGRGRRVLERCARSASATIAISRAVADTVVKGSPMIVTNPVAPPSLPDGAPEWRTGRPTVGFIGRIDPGKGLEDLIGAAHLVDADFVVAGGRHTGSPEYERTIRRLAAAVPDGRMRFIGRVDGPGAVLGAIDALVVPSRMEPWGRVAAEALLAGVPVVAANAGGLPEIIEDGRNGLLFDPGEVVELAACLRRLLGDSDLRRRFSEAGRSSADRFAPDVSARRVARILDTATGP